MDAAGAHHAGTAVRLLPTLSTPPNNFGSLLLIVSGLVFVPVGIGIVPLILGLALVREANGDYTFPQLRGWRQWLQTVQFWRMIKL
jgi:hypothetical protein